MRLTEESKPRGENTTRSGSERGPTAATTRNSSSTPPVDEVNTAAADAAAGQETPPPAPPLSSSQGSSSDQSDDRILSEIESGILDLFSDPYCNKHLLYGALELILVRLMPELAEQGIIELWEERLS